MKQKIFEPIKQCAHAQTWIPIDNIKLSAGNYIKHNIDKINANAILSLHYSFSPDIIGFKTISPNPQLKELHLYHYYINDGEVPLDTEKFKKALDEIIQDVLIPGKSLHISCIGGHGRTGLVLTCLLFMLYERNLFNIKPENILQWLRKVYCEKAVENYSQEKFVFDFMNIKEKYRNYTFKKSKIGYWADYYKDMDF